MNTVLVLAYGSNLDDNQIRARCTSARVEALCFDVEPLATAVGVSS